MQGISGAKRHCPAGVIEFARVISREENTKNEIVLCVQIFCAQMNWCDEQETNLLVAMREYRPCNRESRPSAQNCNNNNRLHDCHLIRVEVFGEIRTTTATRSSLWRHTLTKCWCLFRQTSRTTLHREASDQETLRTAKNFKRTLFLFIDDCLELHDTRSEMWRTFSWNLSFWLMSFV